MAYNSVPTVSTGDTWTAANHNTYIKDNFAAGVPDVFTTAGDTAYATGADALTRLGIGTAGQVLATNSGATAPEWRGLPGLDPLKNISISYYSGTYDNGDSGASKTINWNNGNIQKIKLTGDCAFSFTDPAGPCHLTLIMIGDGTARTPDLDNDADAEYLDASITVAMASTNNEVVGIASLVYDSSSTPKYVVSVDTRGT